MNLLDGDAQIHTYVSQLNLKKKHSWRKVGEKLIAIKESKQRGGRTSETGICFAFRRQNQILNIVIAVTHVYIPPVASNWPFTFQRHGFADNVIFRKECPRLALGKHVSQLKLNIKHACPGYITVSKCKYIVYCLVFKTVQRKLSSYKVLFGIQHFATEFLF